MTRLAFDRALYSGEAVDEAMKAFDRFARFSSELTDAAYVVEVTARHPPHQRKVVGEFANYALGVTVRRGGPR